MDGQEIISSQSEGTKGMILVCVLGFLAILALLGTTAFLMTTTEMKIGKNFKYGERAFYSALAGCEEARARLRGDSPHPINPPSPGDSRWRAYIGTAPHAKDEGYDASMSLHARYDSLCSDFDYTVEIRSQTDASGNVLYWGDAHGDGIPKRNTAVGENIYLVRGGDASGGLRKLVEIETTRVPPLSVPAALYAELTVCVQGANTYVNGEDNCGSDDLPGIVVTGGAGSVTTASLPVITGVGGTNPNVTYGGNDLDIQRIVDSFKGSADFIYAVNAASQGPTDVPGPGDGWGQPAPGATIQDPSSCTDNHIVYYGTGATYVRLYGGVKGCGFLLVEGDLEIDGDFAWYGPIVVTGWVLFTGGGDKQITGAMLTGGAAIVGGAGGDTSIVYCTEAIEDQTKNRPLLILSWKEVM
jgi:hypothetical protein